MRPGRLPPLEWIRAFEAAARLGSFTAAAEEASLTQAAVSQRIGQLESLLGVRLFNRRARSIDLTVEGEAWLPHVRQALDGLRDSAEELFGTDRGRLTISASQSIIELWLLPRLRRIQALTDAQIAIQTLVVGTHDTPQDESIRIRYGAGDWQYSYRAPLYDEEIVPLAAPVLAESPDPWTSWPRIACAGPRPGWDAWSRRYGIPTTPVAKLRFDTHTSALAAAREGLGVVLASRPLALAAIERGALLRLDPQSLPHHESYWLLAGPKALSRRQWQALTEIVAGERPDR